MQLTSIQFLLIVVLGCILGSFLVQKKNHDPVTQFIKLEIVKPQEEAFIRPQFEYPKSIADTIEPKCATPGRCSP
jgi:hypothetical protein